MASTKALEREIEALRARTSDLHAAILRIGASLDVETVLNAVVGAARALIPARCGAITTVDENGQLDDFLAAGFAPEELRRLQGWPGGERFFEHLRDLDAPLRLADFGAWSGSLGLPPGPIPGKTLQVTPVRCRGQYLGAFFLGDKEGGEQFTDADEELLVLLASQAATAIASARTHRAERRARAGLEAVVETAPVGVAVFDAPTGRLVSYNREVDRIAAGLRDPGQSLEAMLATATCRCGAGREVSFAALPLAQALGSAGTMRAEQAELSVPDGRRVRTSINVTPIKSAAGAVESVVVTLQDLAPLEEIERARAEFLSLVSHELRTPLAAIKGSSTSALRTTRMLEPAEAGRFFRIIDEQADRMDRLVSDLLDAGRIGELDLPPGLPRVMADEPRSAGTDDAGSARPAASRPDLAGDPGRRARILVLDDDPHTLRHARDALVAAGYAPLVTADPDDLSRLLRTEKPQLVLLDLMLPGVDGIELMARVPGLAELPVIFISGYGRDETISRALEAGAADCIVKPFSPAELAARVRAALRLRARPTSFALGDLAIDYDRRRVSLAGRALELTVTEYKLLCVLSRHAGKVVTHATLFRQVWGDRLADGTTATRTYVKKLRSKLGDDALRPTYILNERGVGYRMPAPSGPAPGARRSI